MAKSKIIPPSLQPRKIEKKPIPQTTAPVKREAEVPEKEEELSPPPHPSEQSNANKKRFTLWLPAEVFRAFKIHTAGNEGSSSAYIEALIRKDLNL